ncbi:MAG TPA: hypothetical protein VLH19_05780 [Patescibacteria group bacterium]|nr:hypothetical protein [Patescibacteria group bacterium]
MRQFIVVVVVFALISLGIGGFFAYKANVFPKLNPVSPNPKTLVNLLDDCSYRYAENCTPQVVVGAPLPAVITQLMIEMLHQQANKKLSTYTEYYTASQLEALLGKPGDTFHATQLSDKEYSIPEMMALVSDHYYINYKLLIVLLAMGNNSYWDKEAPNMGNPLGRTESAFLYQLDGAASDLRNTFDQMSPDALTLTVGGTNSVVPANLSAASKALYSYFASLSKTPQEFERKISATDPHGFTKTWARIFATPAYTPGTPTPVIQTPNPAAVQESLMQISTESGALQ